MPDVMEIKYKLQQYEPNLSVPTDRNIEDIISGIENDQKSQYEQALVNFLVKEYQKFDIEELKERNTRESLWNALVKLANKTEDNDVLAVVFNVFRIISRNKACVNELVNKEWLDLLMQHSGLNDELFDYSDDSLCRIEEAQKLLWNVVYNSNPEQINNSIHNEFLSKILHRISLYEKTHVPDAIKFYDNKIIFYMTGISRQVRQKVVELNGLQLFITVLKVILKDSAVSLSQSPKLPATLNDQMADVASEALKTLFNLTADNSSITDDKLLQLRELVGILKNYLLASTVTLEKTWQLRNNIVNLLTNIPDICYEELLSPVEGPVPVVKSLKFEHWNMIVIYEILMFLEMKFNDETTIGKQLETYAPILTVLLKGARSNRSIRKYLRLHILPPLKETEKRPEETNSLRGHLCRFLTSPITQLRDLAAELLFVLCKCNVARMIKYTGFGNAAGLLAQKGLLGGEKSVAEGNYSSGSESSDTEEYLEKKHMINPVLGCVNKPHEDPMEGMTDEQKEYEAIKLLQKIDELSRSGIIKPCKVGADGKPQPIDHVLQLQEGLKCQQINDSDSD